jgi:hypothetical protein
MKSYFLILILLGCAGCTIIPSDKNLVTLTIQLPSPSLDISETINAVALPPTTVSGFDCYAINIFGPGISGDLTGDASSAIPPTGCSYLGVASGLMLPAQDTATLTVPSGNARTIQVIGIATGTGCPTMTLRDYLKSLKATYGSGALPVALIELGSQTLDLFKDTDVQIQNTFTSGATSSNRFPFRCTGTATPGIILPLVAAYEGGESGSTPFTDRLTGSLPSGSLTDVSAEKLTALKNPFGSTSIAFGTTSYPARERLDLLFDTAGVNLSAYSSVTVEAQISGGLSAGTCQTTASNLTLPGAEIRIYDATDQAWTTLRGLSTSIQPTVVQFSPVRGPTDLAITETNSGTSLSGKFLHVSIRASNLTVSSSCSNLAVQFVRVSLVP